MVTAYLGLGTNVGDRAGNLTRAISLLRAAVTVDAVSSIYETEPVGHADQPMFWNMAARILTSHSPEELLAVLLDIETRMGRQRTFRNAPRIIDLDILLFDDVVLNAPGLQLPHPRMHERAFVLVPLLELAPDLRDPVTGVSYREVLEQGKFEQVERVGTLAALQPEKK